MNKINFALIGCGRIGSRHAKLISQYGNLTAVCDTNKQAADNLAKVYNAKAYYSIETLLECENKSTAIASICTPNGLHSQHTIKSLKAGLHVICEKPLATSVHDCGEMLKASERANKRLFVVKQNRYNPPVIEVKNILDQNLLGKIYSVQISCFWNRNENYYSNSWKGTKELDGGTLYTQFSHFIDIMYYLIGDVKEAKGMSGNYGHKGIIEFEDSGVVALKFHNGAIGTLNYTVNSFEKNMEGSITIFGEKGTVKIGGQYLNELEYQHIKDYTIKNLPIGNKPNNYGAYQGSMSNHDKVYQNVIGVLQNNDSITTSSFEGLKTIEIIDKIYNSISNL